jgi:hypothetical protein
MNTLSATVYHTSKSARRRASGSHMPCCMQPLNNMPCCCSTCLDAACVGRGLYACSCACAASNKNWGNSGIHGVMQPTACWCDASSTAICCRPASHSSATVPPTTVIIPPVHALMTTIVLLLSAPLLYHVLCLVLAQGPRHTSAPAQPPGMLQDRHRTSTHAYSAAGTFVQRRSSTNPTPPASTANGSSNTTAGPFAHTPQHPRATHASMLTSCGRAVHCCTGGKQQGNMLALTAAVAVSAATLLLCVGASHAASALKVCTNRIV